MRLTSLVATPLIALASFASAQETRIFTDDTGREVEIPVNPQRIASLHDTLVTIPLIEMGTLPAGSFGRVEDGLDPYIRSSAVLTGVDFDNSDIAFLGDFAINVEAVAAIEPDLIITFPWIEVPLDTLEAIGPTVVLDDTKHSSLELYAIVADLAGTTDKLSVLQRRYDAQIAQIRRIIDTENISVAVLQANQDAIWGYHDFGALGQVLADSGFKRPAIIEALGAGGEAAFSVEQIPELDADLIFDNYYATAVSGTPQDQIDNFESHLSGWCDFLAACRNNQYILLPRDESYATSYYTLGLMAMTVLSHMSGVRVVTDEVAE